jgi:hypothetical protein
MEKVKGKGKPPSKAPPEPKKLNSNVFTPHFFDTKNYWFYYTEIQKEK